MARSTTYGTGVGYDVHARTLIVDNWSLISNAAVRVGEDLFEVEHFGKVYFNGQEGVAFPIKMSNGYEITTEIELVTLTHEDGTVSQDTRNFYHIQMGDDGDERITIVNYMAMISVEVDPSLESTGGMLGTPEKDGMIGRESGEVTSDPIAMGAQWQVRDNEPMLFSEIRAPQYPEQCRLPSATQRHLLRVSDNFKALARKSCSVLNSVMAEFCYEDALRTGNANVVHGYIY